MLVLLSMPPHLLFIDEILILCEGTRRMIENLREIINLLYEATCMKFNIDKSIISYWGLSNNKIVLYSQVFPFQVLGMDEGLKYPGFHLKSN
jgi:hypothetical protein